MKTLVMTMALLGLTPAFAADKPAKKYRTHFENPVVDDRIEFIGCALEKGLMGALDGDTGDVLCWGNLKTDTGKNKTTYYVYKAENRKTQDYFEEIDSKDLGASGDQAGGVRESSATLKEVSKDLSAPSKASRSTLHFRTEWMYSEGSTILTGKLPGTTEKRSMAVFYLNMIDQEMEDFAAEISR